MKTSAVFTQESKPVGDGSTRAAEDSGSLSMGDLGDEGTEEAEVELGLLQSVVDAERLSREGAAALETQEPLDRSAVAGSVEVSLEAPASMAGRARGTIGTRTELRLEAHGIAFLSGAAGDGFPGATRRINLGCRPMRKELARGADHLDSRGGQIPLSASPIPAAASTTCSTRRGRERAPPRCVSARDPGLPARSPPRRRGNRPPKWPCSPGSGGCRTLDRTAPPSLRS